MAPEECNLTEIKMSRPVRNRTAYKAIAPRNLDSISSFSESSIIASELGSTSQPTFNEKQHVRKI
jgi:hypothetical protein